jgi:hypothetical protein
MKGRIIYLVLDVCKPVVYISTLQADHLNKDIKVNLPKWILSEKDIAIIKPFS